MSVHAVIDTSNTAMQASRCTLGTSRGPKGENGGGIRIRAIRVKVRYVAATATQNVWSKCLDSNADLRPMLGAGIEPAFPLWERDFKSLASASFATRAHSAWAILCGNFNRNKNDAPC